MQSVISPKNLASALTDFWTPHIIGSIEDLYIKVAKLNGSLVWHQHDDEDELFFILQGRLRIEMATTTIELEQGDLYVVPKGVRHFPTTEDTCTVMLIEKKTTLHTGDITTRNTKSIQEQLHPPWNGQGQVSNDE